MVILILGQGIFIQIDSKFSTKNWVLFSFELGTPFDLFMATSKITLLLKGYSLAFELLFSGYFLDF